MSERSVDVLVAEAVERGRDALKAVLIERGYGGDMAASDADDLADAALDAAGFPALVEALARLADAEKVEDADPLEWATWAHELAVAALGGVRVSGRAELEAESARLQARVDELEAGMADEALIVQAQALSLSPRALGKGRRKIIVTQIERMLRTALGGHPRPASRRWRERATEALAAVDGETTTTKGSE